MCDAAGLTCNPHPGGLSCAHGRTMMHRSNIRVMVPVGLDSMDPRVFKPSGCYNYEISYFLTLSTVMLISHSGVV